MGKLELKKIWEIGNRTYYIVNNYLPVMEHAGWVLVRGKSVYNRPPFVLEYAHCFNTLEELVNYWHTKIAPNKVKEATQLIKFYEGFDF